MSRPAAGTALAAGWLVSVAAALGIRVWNALAEGALWGYDAWGHAAYVLFLDAYRAVPWPDQGWSYFHPPLYYALAWLLVPFGSGEVLMRGLALFGSAASLGTALLAAWLVRRVAPERPGLSLLGFSLVAFLPVHLYVGPMPGNEMLSCLLTAAATCVAVANQARARPALRGDAATGLLLGLGLLVKFTGLVAMAALAAAPLVGAALARPGGRVLARGLLRGAVVAGVALALAAPYYARNLAVYGTPLVKSSAQPEVALVEREQPPGVRRLSDYARISPRLFADPNPLAPHLIHSVWGPLYLSIWADVYRESDSQRALEAEYLRRRSTTWMALLGLFPTALFLHGALAAGRDALRGRRRFAYLPLGLLAAASLASFALYAWVQPTWPALRASYLLALSLPYAGFVTRSLEAWGRMGRPLAALLAALCALAAAIGTLGVALPRRAAHPAAGAVHFYFGEYAAARRSYARLIETSAYPVAWLENLAALELAEGRAERARALYARAEVRARASGREDVWRQGRLAVASAVAGDPAAALQLLDAALVDAAAPPELRANRGALRAARGDLSGAEADLRASLEAAPEMVPAWRNLSLVLLRQGRAGEASAALDRATRAACRGPRGYPYAVGTGEAIEWGIGRRPLLLLEGASLGVAQPGFYRTACRRLRAAATR